ncbi:MAG: hypothetical protein DRI44_07960 [Chlamydiae bacterium]|nr:MAG: hypothetical protein DRI44_07960 [Chlamydiota bacterium]
MIKFTFTIIFLIILSLNLNAKTIGYWRFEEGENGIQHAGDKDDWYKDSSGFTNDMSSWWEPSRPTPTNSLPFSVVPQTGVTNLLAMDFIPSDDLGPFGAEQPYMIDSYPFTNGFTVECMVKVRQINWQVAVGKDGKPSGSGDPTFHIKFRNDAAEHKIHLGFFDTDLNWVSCMSTFNYNIGEWYYIAAVCDGTQAYLYVKQEADDDYELESTVTVPSGKGMLVNNETWTIGRGMWNSSVSDWVDGIIDEVRISDIALATNKFLGFGIQIVVTGAPEFVSVDYSDDPTPVETRDVTVQTFVKARNTIITNVDLYYRVNNSGAYIGPIQMTTNAASPFVFYGNIISQAIDSAVDFYMVAANAQADITTSSIYHYKVYEDIEWKTVVATSDLAPYTNPTNMPAMAIAPNGKAAFVYSSASGNNAQYIEETSLGTLSSPVPISTDQQGSIAGIVFGTDNEPRALLSYDIDGGDTFVQRTNTVWTIPIMIVTNILEEKRAVISISPDKKTSVLWYEDGDNANGKLVDVNTAGDSYTSAEVTVPPFPISPNALRRPFNMKTGTDGKRRIVISGPGNGDNQIWFGTEDSAESGTFAWEQVMASNLYADQIGFTLDNNNCAYISCEDNSEGGANSKCVLLENSNGSWEQHTLGDIADLWNRSAIAVDINGNVWVAHNARTYDHFYLWSNRSGNWKEEQTITNKEVIETISGFGFTDNNIMKISYVPYNGSTKIVYMYSTKFEIPEPGMIIDIIALALLAFRKQ